MALTTEQNALINNLMYLDSSCGMNIPTMNQFEGMSLGEWISAIDTGMIDPNKEYNNFTTGEEWLDIIEAVRNDDTLMNMTINEVHVDNATGGGQGRSAVLTSEQSGDAVVVFKGTQTDAEWADNFAGGNTTDTPQQENALEWYQDVYEKYGLEEFEVTVTGHSKGGNKAKYITILDGTVDHCESFDGQGFSDQFMEKYESQIAARQDAIQNHNIDYDYVNLLLNDVGETTYYYGYNIDNGGFLENHCPNTFLQFNEDGTFQMNVNPDGQPEAMQALDEFLNNYLRSMPDEDRAEALQLVNTILTGAPSSGDASTSDMINFFLQLAADPQYSDDLAYFVAYLVEYEQANPELVEQINSILEAFGMGDVTEYLDMVDSVLNMEVETWFGTITFDSIWDLLDGASGNLPDWLIEWFSNLLEEKWGIQLTPEQIRNLLEIIRMVDDDMESITVEENGEDIRIQSSSSGGSCEFAVDTQQLRRCAGNMQRLIHSLEGVASSVGSHSGRVCISFAGSAMLRARLAVAKNEINQLGGDVSRIAAALGEIAELYENAENSITGNAGS